MVNRGASNGCLTCKQRRVKCDEAKPRCQQCLRLGRECTGYGKRAAPVRFKDQTSRYSRKTSEASKPATRPAKTSLMMTTTMITPSPTPSPPTAYRELVTKPYDYAILSSPLPAKQDLAISFFLTYTADIGRGEGSTRGFMDFVRSALVTERHDSALYTAVSAVSAKIWAILDPSRTSLSLPGQLLGHALVRLQTALQDSRQRGRDETILAALVLQLYETFSAVFGQYSVREIHRHGATTLLLRRAASSNPSKFHGNLLANLLHSKVSLCIRKKIPFTADELEWLESSVVPALPVNPSSLLDLIGVSIASLQHDFEDALSLSGPIPRRKSRELWQRIQSVDEQLETWLQDIPQHWVPASISSRDISTSIETHKNACDVYPSVQIASIWNVWRIYRLILIQMQLRLAIDTPAFSRGPNHDIKGLEQLEEDAGDLVEAVCLSVPFYLGNRMCPAILTTMDSPELMFPSYHDLPPGEGAFQKYRVGESFLSRDDHARHAILQGPWRIMSLLAFLIGLSGEDVGQMFQQEQKDWIQRQFLRSLYLQQLLPSCPIPRTHNRHDTLPHKDATEPWNVESLARKIRQGLGTMNIL